VEIVSCSPHGSNPRRYRNPNNVNRLSPILGDSGVSVPSPGSRMGFQNGVPERASIRPSDCRVEYYAVVA
jgi:hypothetical protein